MYVQESQVTVELSYGSVTSRFVEQYRRSMIWSCVASLYNTIQYTVIQCYETDAAMGAAILGGAALVAGIAGATLFALLKK